MSEIKHTLKHHNLKMSEFMRFIEEEKRPSYFGRIVDGEYEFVESDLNDFLEIGDMIKWQDQTGKESVVNVTNSL